MQGERCITDLWGGDRCPCKVVQACRHEGLQRPGNGLEIAWRLAVVTQNKSKFPSVHVYVWDCGFRRRRLAVRDNIGSGYGLGFVQNRCWQPG